MAPGSSPQEGMRSEIRVEESSDGGGVPQGCHTAHGLAGVLQYKIGIGAADFS